MACENTHNEDCCVHTSATPYTQTLEEVDFERSIHYACTLGDIKKVERFIERGCDVNKLDAYGYAPLHYAARQGNLAICRLLIEHGADVDVRTPELGSTPLHRAVVQGHLKVVKLLKSAGANLGVINTEGQNVAHLALKHNNQEIIEFLKTANSDLFSINC